MNANYNHSNLLSKIASYMILLFAFSIPLSTTLTGIALYAIISIWFIDKNAYLRWQFYQSYPLTKPIFLFISIQLVGILYSTGNWGSAFSSFYKVSRLSMIPILAYYIHNTNKEYKNVVLYSFLAAIIVTILCTLIKVYGHIAIGQRTYGHDVFKNHIAISYFMATSLLFLWVWLTEYKRLKIGLILLIGLILYYLIFLNTGRTGFIVLYCSFMGFAWHKYGLRGPIMSSLLLSLIMVFAYQFSDTFSIRMNDLYDEFQLYLQGNVSSAVTESSLNRRFEFAINSFKMFLQSPMVGFGTGSFANTYKEFYADTFEVMTNNPHSQYLKTAVELGLIGLLCLSWLFYKQWEMTKKLTGTHLILAQSILLSFFIGCLFNTWLINFSECHFYYLMTALFISHADKNQIVCQPFIIKKQFNSGC